jgi:dTDP-4-dehydrorhamnose reductase
MGRFGTYHVTNGGSRTRYEFALEILTASKIDAPLERTTSAAFPSFARRPRFSVLANNALARAGVNPAPDWKAGLHAYLKAAAQRA